MHSQFIITLVTFVECMSFIYSLLCLIFCVLALFVLVYYIRRRYKLYKEINRIPQELLIMESYRNHLKNLKLKCSINNFIIVILVIEFLQNLGHFFFFFPYLIIFYVPEPGFNVRSLWEVQKNSILFTLPISYSYFPVLSMMMDFLWIAYRKYEYKYTIIRWTWYIVIRTLVIFLLQYSSSYILISIEYQTLYGNLTEILYGILPIIDFIQFVYYARKFYLHLKSREKEIRLFYFDKKAYLDSKYLRIHFKIATILVGTAFFFFTLRNTSNILYIFREITYYISIPQESNNSILAVFESFVDFFGLLSYLISEVLFIFNYLYIFIIVVYKSYRDGQKLKNINNYIRPIMKQYHDSYYNRHTNYA